MIGKRVIIGPLLLCWLCSFAQNPALPEEWELYIADPEPKVFNGRVYVYGSKDDGAEKGWCSDRYHVVSSGDLINWTDHGESFHLSDVPVSFRNKDYRKLWAPDLIRHPVNGKYYLFFCFNHTSPRSEQLMVAESDRPEGPFNNARPLTIDGQPIVAIDPAVMVDDDGKAYVTWPFKMAQLDPDDYSKIIAKTLVDVAQWMPVDNTPFEGPSLRKRGDTYYYIYIQNDGMRYLPDSTTYVKPSRMAYLTSKNPLGPYEYRGLIIENSNYPGAINIHGSLVDFKNQWYVFYHLPVADKKVTRRTCIEPITFDSQGRILPVLITSSGVKRAFTAGDTIYAASTAIYSNATDVRYISRPGKKAYIEFNKGGSFAGFRYVDFSERKPKSVELCVRSGYLGGLMELHIDGPDGALIASVPVSQTTDWQQLTVPVLKMPKGKKTVYLLFKSRDNKPLDLEWFRFYD